MLKKLLNLTCFAVLALNLFTYGAGSVNKGHTFSTSEEVTATKLNNLVDNSTLSGIDQTNIASNYGVVYTGASAPSDTDALWRDTGASNILKYYTGSAWEEVSSALSGSIVAYVSETPPAGYLECDGSDISRTTYATLFAIIGVVYGDGSGTGSATHFTLPDLRGKFPRGWDNGATNDPNAATRTAQTTGGTTGDHVGSVQADGLKSHLHTLAIDDNGCDDSGGSNEDSAGGSQSMNTGSTGGSETRPINVNVMYIIKY